jgi:hypothetical protein
MTPTVLGTIRVELTWDECNALEQQAVFYHALLRGPCSPQLRTYIAAKLLAASEAEGRLSAALIGESFDDAGNHYAGLPPRHTGLGGEL